MTLLLRSSLFRVAGLYMEGCNSDPTNCITHRCFYSESLGDEEWYLADNGQLIASFVRGNGHQIPPLSATKMEHSAAAASFNGPAAGLGEACQRATTANGDRSSVMEASCDSHDRCGNMRGANDMGSTAMCKGTTTDGRLFLTLAEIETRCAADQKCVGFSQDTKDGPAYFRPLAAITSIGQDPKWTTWTKGPMPPAPPAPPPTPPSPSPADWFDTVDVPFCLATAPSSSPPKKPATPPDVHMPACDGDKPTLLIFAGPLAGGSIAVGLSNKCSGNHTIVATFEQIGAAAGTKYKVRDAINHLDLPDASSSVTAVVGEHDIAVLRLDPK